jgi:hypothetical protein
VKQKSKDPKKRGLNFKIWNCSRGEKTKEDIIKKVVNDERRS